MAKKLYNFCAGPGAVPEPVLIEASEQLLDYQQSGLSILEISHRSITFEQIYDEARRLIRELFKVPDQFEILLLQGGASLQFFMAPLNLALKGKSADVLHTGYWSKKAIVEVGKVTPYRIVASSEDREFSYIPDVNKSDFSSDASFVYITTNNTIYGTQWHTIPDTGEVPIVADMTSDIFSRPIDFSNFGVIFASAQKNLGIAGVTVVIVRRDLADRCSESVGTILQYRTHIERDTVYHTAPTFSIYILELMLNWVKKQGGISALQKINREKAKRLYAVVDHFSLYSSRVDEKDRSEMNICFFIHNPHLKQLFVDQAIEQGFVGLGGHSKVGGFRVSLYNAVSLEAVDVLAAFMTEFAKKHS